MNTTKRSAWLVCALLWVLGPASQAYSQPSGSSEGVLVGRISHVTGKLLRYVPEEKDWVVTVKDAPFGLNDALYSDRSARAEFVMPNGTLVRTGSDTQIQLIALQPEVTEIDVASGIARFYNRGEDTVIKATTPFGFVVARSGTVFDLYVGDESLEVIALKGSVEFVLESDQTRYEVKAGSSSLLSDGKRVASGEGNVDADWDDWNAERDSLWTKKAQVKGDSVRYVPPPLYDDAYELDEYGRWERVYYEDSYHYLWRPTYVHSGWRPYTVGRWTDYYGDHCWIPAEPFGYVTHHYGSWLYVNDFWYWAPPVVGVSVSIAPAVSIGFGWYPGRVGWIGSGVHIGWFPLAPRERYYSRYYWGPEAVVVNNIGSINININNYRYADYAVGIPRNSFYTVNNYYNHNIINIDRSTIINNNYAVAPVVSDRIFADFDRRRERFMFTNAVPDVVPHREVLGRIERNQLLGREVRGLSASAIERDVSRFRPGALDRGAMADLQRPTLRSRLVSPADVSRPVSDVRFEQRDFRTRARAAQESPVTRMQTLDERRIRGRMGEPGVPGQALQPGGQPGDLPGRRVRPGVEGQPGQMGEPGTIQPPVERGRRVRPTAPGQEQQPGALEKPGESRGRSLRPGREIQPDQSQQLPRSIERRPGRTVTRPEGEPTPGESPPAVRREGTGVRRVTPPAQEQAPPRSLQDSGAGSRQPSFERRTVPGGQMGVVPGGTEGGGRIQRNQRIERRQQVQEQPPQMMQRGRQMQQAPAVQQSQPQPQLQRGRQMQQAPPQQAPAPQQRGRGRVVGQPQPGEEEQQQQHQPGLMRGR
ncbi:MAG: hypothetical protein GX443_01520 [Deltaproteobacteria bacterium]|nr:hypothetical protein [Deltaproteobacteria bacterium]